MGKQKGANVGHPTSHMGAKVTVNPPSDKDCPMKPIGKGK